MEQIWIEWRDSNLPISNQGWKCFAIAVAENPDINFTKQIWNARLESSIPLSSLEFEAYAKTAGRFGRVDLLKEVWQVLQRSKAHLSSRMFQIFTWASGRCKNEDLLSEIWNVSQKSKVHRPSRLWQDFATAAAKCKNADLLTQIWKTWQESKASLSSKGWEAFAMAARVVDSVVLLEEIWQKWLVLGVKLENHAWSAFVLATCIDKGSGLYRQIYNKWKLSGVKLIPWKWSALVYAAGKNCEGDIVEELWFFYQTHNKVEKIKDLVPFAKASQKTKRVDILDQIWLSIKRNQILLKPQTWAHFVTAFSVVGRKDLLENIWRYSEIYENSLHFQDFVSFAVNAKELQMKELLMEIWGKWINGNFKLSFRNFNRFYDIYRDVDINSLNDSILKLLPAKAVHLKPKEWLRMLSEDKLGGKLNVHICRSILDFKVQLDNKVVSYLVTLANQEEQGQLLNDIWNEWKTNPQTLKTDTWIRLVKACWSKKEKSLIIEIWNRRKKSMKDISEWNAYYEIGMSLNLGEIRRDLNVVISNIEIDKLLIYIQKNNFATRNNNDKLAIILRQLGCFMIKLYCSGKRFRFDYLLNKIVYYFNNFDKNKVLIWNLFLCQGQEAYEEYLLFMTIRKFYDKFSKYILDRSKLNNDYQEMISSIMNGNVANEINEFIGDVKFVYRQSCGTYGDMENMKINSLEPLIDYMLGQTSRRIRDFRYNSYYMKGKKRRLKLLKKTEDYLKVGNVENYNNEDWIEFINKYFYQVIKTVNDEIYYQINSKLHDLKNKIDRYYRPAIREISEIESDIQEIVQRISKSFEGFYLSVPNRTTEKHGPIDIIAEVRRSLIGGYKLQIELNTSIPTECKISGWDGICENYLRPLLKEIRNNAEKALEKNPINKRLLIVSVKNESNDNSGYAIIEVSNSFSERMWEKDLLDPFSSGTGLKYIAELVKNFRYFNKIGKISFPMHPDDIEDMFTIQLYLPLWPNPSVSKIDMKGESNELSNTNS